MMMMIDAFDCFLMKRKKINVTQILCTVYPYRHKVWETSIEGLRDAAPFFRSTALTHPRFVTATTMAMAISTTSTTSTTTTAWTRGKRPARRGPMVTTVTGLRSKMTFSSSAATRKMLTTRASASSDEERMDDSDDVYVTQDLAQTLAREAYGMVESNTVVGVSRGEHAAELMRLMSDGLKSGALENVRVVALEPLAAKEAAVNGLEMRTLDEVPAIDVTFVQPSECAVVMVDGKKSFASLLGRETTPVQPDLQRAKAALKKSAKVVLMKELFVDKLGGSVPVVIEAENWEEYAEELDDLFLGDAEVWRRGATFDANPRGGKNPYVSADGEHTIVDLRFEDPINSGRWECGLMLDGKPCTAYELQQALEEEVSGILAHGIYMQGDVVVTMNPETMEAITIARD